MNEVAVSRVAPHRFEYRETLRWVGPPPESAAASLKPEDLAEIKSILPKELATDANARALAEKASRLAVPLLFGPGEPLLPLALIHPDLATRRAGQRIDTLLLKALEEQFGGKLTPAARREVARRLMETTFAEARPSKPDPAAGPPKSKGPSLVPLLFIVKSGGKVISSNGDVDELTGEVYWGLFPEAASLEPVVLTAVVQLD